MAAYLRQSLAGLVCSERQAIEQEIFALGPSAIALAVALDALDLALARSQRRAEGIEQPPSGEQLMVGAGETVAQGTEIQPVLGVVHTDEPTQDGEASESPFGGTC